MGCGLEKRGYVECYIGIIFSTWSRNWARLASIESLNRLVDDGLLTYGEGTGKGGHHRIYRAAMTRLEWNRHIYDLFVCHIQENFHPF